jgi:hypothetical protein
VLAAQNGFDDGNVSLPPVVCFPPLPHEDINSIAAKDKKDSCFIVFLFTRGSKVIKNLL